MKLRALLLAFGIVLMSSALLVVNAQTAKDSGEQTTGSGISAGDAATNALPVGWNVVLSQNCQIYNPTSSTVEYRVYATNGAFFWSTNWQYQNVMEVSCQTGKWMAFYVFDGPTGAWSSIYTWTF